jgi:hypothetical protein
VPALFFAADPDNGLVFEYSASSPVDSVSNGIVDLTGADDYSTYKQQNELLSICKTVAAPPMNQLRSLMKSCELNSYKFTALAKFDYV